VKARSMPYNLSDPNYWFNRAEEVRISANAMKNPANKTKMLRIAEDFEVLGHRVDQLPKKIGKQPPRKKRLRRLF
jgi:hypothetical protein